VCADLAGLLEEEDAEVFIARFVGELLQANGGAETGGAWAEEVSGRRASKEIRGSLPPPIMHTSTSSDSRSMLAGSNDSSSVSAERTARVVAKVLSGAETATAHRGRASPVVGLVAVARHGRTARAGRHLATERVPRCRPRASGVEDIAAL
jgi:hypothetical protein